MVRFAFAISFSWSSDDGASRRPEVRLQPRIGKGAVFPTGMPILLKVQDMAAISRSKASDQVKGR